MLEEGLYSLLSNAYGIQSALGTPNTRSDQTTGIFPDLLPEQSTLPAIVYQGIAATSVNSMDGTNALQAKRIQFDCYADSRNEAKRAAEAVKDILFGFRGALGGGAVIEAVIPVLETDNFEQGPFIFRQAVDLEIWFAEATGA